MTPTIPAPIIIKLLLTPVKKLLTGVQIFLVNLCVNLDASLLLFMGILDDIVIGNWLIRLLFDLIGLGGIIYIYTIRK